MNNTRSEPEHPDDDMHPEYDFSGKTGVRGKYYQALRQGYTIKIEREDGTTLVQHIVRPEGTITLDPDVQDIFSRLGIRQPSVAYVNQHCSTQEERVTLLRLHFFALQPVR